MTWATAKQLAGLPGFPSSERRAQEAAKRAGLPARPRSGRGGGFEYSVESLPAAARTEWAIRFAAANDDAARVHRAAGREATHHENDRWERGLGQQGREPRVVAANGRERGVVVAATMPPGSQCVEVRLVRRRHLLQRGRRDAARRRELPHRRARRVEVLHLIGVAAGHIRAPEAIGIGGHELCVGRRLREIELRRRALTAGRRAEQGQGRQRGRAGPAEGN